MRQKRAIRNTTSLVLRSSCSPMGRWCHQVRSLSPATCPRMMLRTATISGQHLCPYPIQSRVLQSRHSHPATKSANPRKQKANYHPAASSKSAATGAASRSRPTATKPGATTPAKTVGIRDNNAGIWRLRLAILCARRGTISARILITIALLGTGVVRPMPGVR